MRTIDFSFGVCARVARSRVARAMTMKSVAVMVVALSASACNGKTDTTSSPSPITAPPPVTSSTPYSGVWEGRYRIDRCDGTGSIQDLFCSQQRGLYPPGTTLPIRLDLTQSGSSVTGRIELGSLTGPVTGSVRSNGLLTLAGTARGGLYTWDITYWDTRAVGAAMDGSANFNVSYQNIPGVALISTTLQGVTRR